MQRVCIALRYIVDQLVRIALRFQEFENAVKHEKPRTLPENPGAKKPAGESRRVNPPKPNLVYVDEE